ncbi:MAG: hypothetical protein ACR2JF_10940 [Iamia sp.]
MPTPPTLAAALVQALRSQGRRPSTTGSDAPTWSEVADRSRRLSIGLAEAGWAGQPMAVEPSGRPSVDIERELAVLTAGAILALPGSDPAARIADEGLHPRDQPSLTLAEVVAAGEDCDARDPAGAERRLAALDPSAPACVEGRRTLTHGEVHWGLRAVHRWLTPAFPDGGPAAVVAGGRTGGSALSAALVGRWWPATLGARLAPEPSSVIEVGDVAADLVLLDGPAWAALAGRARERAAHSLGGGALLRRGRLVVSGESRSGIDRAALHGLRWWAGDRVRHGAGLGGLRLGLALEPVDVATRRDLAAVGVALASTWTVEGAAAPLAAGPVAPADPTASWGRPLPGRRIELVGAGAVAFGGDLPEEGLAAPGPGRVDGRGRVALPGRPRSDPRSVGAGAGR